VVLLPTRPSPHPRGCDAFARHARRACGILGSFALSRCRSRPHPSRPQRPVVRSDLDRLMQQRGLAGLVVLALDRYSPAFYYCTGQKIHHGFYVRTAQGRAHLVHDPMERDQAALVGCEATSYAQRGLLQKVKSADSQAVALASWWRTWRASWGSRAGSRSWATCPSASAT